MKMNLTEFIRQNDIKFLDLVRLGLQQGKGMTIAERLLAQASSETERISAKQKLFKMTGSCEP